MKIQLLKVAKFYRRLYGRGPGGGGGKGVLPYMGMVFKQFTLG